MSTLANVSGKVVGGGLIVAATAAIWMWPEAEAPAAAPEPVRPIRSAVVVRSQKQTDLKFSGTVESSATRKLAFKVSGRIERIPVAKGDRVKKGTKLAWLDQGDLRDKLSKAEAEFKGARETYDRLCATRTNAVSRQVITESKTKLDSRKAEYELARRALEDSVLYAPFDAVVAEVPADELDMASPSLQVIRLLKLDKIHIDVSVPENVVIIQPELEPKGKGTCYATFDSAQSKRYPVTFIEYKATADKKNQTFVATYELDAPQELMLLPGMSATVTLPGDAYQLKTEGSETLVEVPESAVAVDTDKSYYAWVLVELKDQPGVFEVRKRKLGPCHHVAGVVKVETGLAIGERVATAGLTLLTEGRRVTLLKDAAK